MVLWADLELVGRRTTRGRLGRCNPCATLLFDCNRLNSIDGKNGNGWGSIACSLLGDDSMSYGFMVNGESLAPASPRGGGGTGAVTERGVFHTVERKVTKQGTHAMSSSGVVTRATTVAGIGDGPAVTTPTNANIDGGEHAVVASPLSSVNRAIDNDVNHERNKENPNTIDNNDDKDAYAAASFAPTTTMTANTNDVNSSPPPRKDPPVIEFMVGGATNVAHPDDFNSTSNNDKTNADNDPTLPIASTVSINAISSQESAVTNDEVDALSEQP